MSYQESVLRGNGTGERQGTGCGLQGVGGVDVVFEDDGDAVQQAARPLGGAFLVQGVGNGQGVGIEFDDRVDLWVQQLNASQILFNKDTSGETAVSHSGLQILDGGLE